MRFDGSEPERCARCGFDSRRWRRHDASVVLDLLGLWWRLATAGSSVEELNRRPALGVWSALEYGLHSAMVLPILRQEIEGMLAHDRADVHDPCPEVDTEDASRPLTLDPGPILEALEREGAAFGRIARDCRAGWEHVGRMDDGTWWQAEATLLHAVHDTTHHFLDVAEGLVRVGSALPAAEATVSSVNVSDGGLPKLPVGAAAVLADGLEGDRHADTSRHGRPFQAVCLWSSEMIAELAGRGRAVAAGTAGENLTLSGVDWSRLRSGTRLLAGSALLELSYPVEACRARDHRSQGHDAGRRARSERPGQGRWYAWVRRPGHVRAGDPVVVSPG